MTRFPSRAVLTAALAKIATQSGDAHRQTAAALHGKAEKAVTPADRAAAQAVNFATLYGTGTGIRRD